MPEVHEVREVPVSIPVRRRRSGLSAMLMFLFGAILILVAAVVVLRPTWTVSWPAGRLDIGLGYQPSTSATTSTASSASLRNGYALQSAEAN